MGFAPLTDFPQELTPRPRPSNENAKLTSSCLLGQSILKNTTSLITTENGTSATHFRVATNPDFLDIHGKIKKKFLLDEDGNKTEEDEYDKEYLLIKLALT